MDLYIQIIVVACLTGMTSLLAHRSAAVFHDGIRPILPQLIEGYMNRREAGSIAFGLSIGFVASVGISFTLKTGLLNAWLLFLPTDILGVLAINSLMAFGLGAIWGILILTCLLPVNQLLTALPVDVLGSLGELSSPVANAVVAINGTKPSPRINSASAAWLISVCDCSGVTPAEYAFSSVKIDTSLPAKIFMLATAAINAPTMAIYGKFLIIRDVRSSNTDIPLASISFSSR